jgi:murein DD-endopeptidase MepM/ murein hydrolase activator NlpD
LLKPTSEEPRLKSPLLRFGLPVALFTMAAVLVQTTSRIEGYAESPYPVVRNIPFSAGLETLIRSGAGWSSDEVSGVVPVELPLRPGQTVGGVLSDLALEPREIQQIVGELSRFADLRRLKPEDGYAVVFEDQTDRVASFNLTLAGRGQVQVGRNGEGWTGSWRRFERWTQVDVVNGALEGALESSIQRAGGDTRLAVSMSDVFQWDLDFNRDLRLGDEFEILYEKVQIDGSYTTLGEILAVHYTNLGKTIQAYRFGDPAGYYDAEGRPLRKMFLRSPMRYSRITSRYSNRRFHPVLKRHRPHYGVDYGAPTGTPVRVTSSGVVSFAGWDSGGGKMVKVRHPNGYLTAYLHLSRFASGVKSGRRVSQGDTIGYVGATGLATGPHLDYRVQRHGKWIDPLSLKSVPAEPIPVDNLEAFHEWRDAMRSSLGSGSVAPELVALRAEESGAEDDSDTQVEDAQGAGLQTAGS